MEFLTFWDAVLTPFYLLILVYWGKAIRERSVKLNDPLRKYFMPGLYAKFAGAIFIGLIYAYYYKGGDTFNYFHHARVINSALDDSFVTWGKLLMQADPGENPEIYSYVTQLEWYNSDAEYFVAVITALLGFFTFTTYLPTALLFAFISFFGIWAMFRTFAAQYPNYHKPLAIAFLFIPSSVIWGSGIFKDTLCMFGLGWLTYSTFRIFINKDFSIRNIFLVVLSFYVVASSKLYILLAFMPALILWLLMTYSKKIRSVGLRWIINIFFMGLTVVGFLFFSQQFAKQLNKYSLEKIQQTAKVTQAWTNYASGDDGSSYNIGEIDGSLTGFLALFPKGVVVSLFRPFPWEVKKVIVGLSAIEGLMFAYFTLMVLFNRKAKPLKYLFRDPTLLFCFVFSIIFAFAVGVSSGNFGALSRYKIPCLPFYSAVLAIMLGEHYFKKQRKTVGYKRQALRTQTI